jgi:hypothetical protein
MKDVAIGMVTAGPIGKSGGLDSQSEDAGISGGFFRAFRAKRDNGLLVAQSEFAKIELANLLVRVVLHVAGSRTRSQSASAADALLGHIHPAVALHGVMMHRRR